LVAQSPNRASVRLRAALLLVVFGAACVLAAASAQGAVSAKIYVRFTVSHTFVVTFADGSTVGTTSAPGVQIPPGTYQIVLDNSDNVKDMTFYLAGPGVQLITNMGGGEATGDTQNVTFQANAQYQFYDQGNPGPTTRFISTSASGSNGGDVSSPVSGANSGGVAGSTGGNNSLISSKSAVAAAAIYRGILSGSVSPAGAVTLLQGGKAVTRLKAGRYRVTVTDRSATDGLVIGWSKGDPVSASGSSFVGTRSSNVVLTDGRWIFYATTATKKHDLVVYG